MNFLVFITAALTWRMLTKQLPTAEIFGAGSIMHWIDFTLCLSGLAKIQEIIATRLKAHNATTTKQISYWGMMIAPLIFVYSFKGLTSQPALEVVAIIFGLLTGSASVILYYRMLDSISLPDPLITEIVDETAT